MTDKNHTKKFAEVILPLAAAGTYTYSLADHSQNVQAGSRVLVEFGRKKMYAGIVYMVHTDQPQYKTKPILDLLDKEPVVSAKELEFWEWMANYYICTLGEVCEAALPAMFKIHSETKIYSIEEELPEDYQNTALGKAFNFINTQNECSIKDLQTLYSPAQTVHLVRKLTEMRVIGVREAVSERFKPKTIRKIHVNNALAGQNNIDEQALKRSPAQKKVIQYLWNEKMHHTRAEIKEKTGVSDAVIKNLIDKNWLKELEIRVDRFDLTGQEVEPIPVLSDAQQQAFEKTAKAWSQNRPVLLYGVTSSGKTELYFHLISNIIKKGKQALVLLPEIALTGQLVKRFQKVFGDKVGVYHSRIHAAQRLEIWQNVKNLRHFQVIIGPRSAIFLPYKDLGCIIVDEEHDRSYKQQNPAPRYNARDATIVLSNLHKANVVLGTATPSLESLANYKAGKYDLVKLTERFGNFVKPEIIIADYAKWYKRHKVKAHLTPILENAINESLQKNRQIILFQNRRGFSPYLQCFDCGHIPVCPHCDVRLTYHKRNNTLVCHYCGFTKKNSGKCPDCGNSNLKTMGFGTEKIEEEIQPLFPRAHIARFDQDATRKKNSHETIIGRFDAHDIDILVGTQMVTKGLDFKNVDLVGVLNADNLFSFPDFRSFERSMQMLMQVAGRAGRHGNHGKVIIQTSQPEHAVIQYLTEGNFAKFAENELVERHQFGYPPFTRIIKISIKHKKVDTCARAANIIATKSRKISGTKVLGPQEPAIARIQQYFIKEIFIKMERSSKTLQIKKAVQEVISETKKIEGLKSIIIQTDMDPY